MRVLWLPRTVKAVVLLESSEHWIEGGFFRSDPLTSGNRHPGRQRIWLGWKRKKKFIDELKQRLENPESGDGNEIDLEKLLQDFQESLPKETIASILDYSRTTRQNIIDGKTFISDEEAASLGVAFAHNSIELKMRIIDLVDSATGLIVTCLSAPAALEKALPTEIAQLAWKGILVSKNIDSFTGAARAIARKSLIALTVQNIRKGGSLT